MKKINIDELLKNASSRGNNGFVPGSPIINSVAKKLREENSGDIDNNITEDDIEAVVSEEETHDNVEEQSEIKITNRIKNATLLNLSSTANDNRTIATLSWLCLDEKDALFTLCTNYLVEEDDMDFIEKLEMFEGKQFTGIQIGVRMILAKLPSYVTDMHFYTHDKSITNNTTSFLVDAIKVSESGILNKVTFEVNNELFDSLQFMDNYVFDRIINNYNLSLAVSSAGMADARKDTSIFIIDNIDSIISIAPIDRKSTTVAVVFRAYHYIDKDQKESVSILSTFDLGIKFHRSKFKGCTFDKIQRTFLIDSDQYMNNLISIATFKDIDKEYMILKGTNKNKYTKLFMMDRGVQSQLESLIQNY